MGAIPERVYQKIKALQKEGEEFRVTLHGDTSGKITKATLVQELTLSESEQTDR